MIFGAWLTSLLCLLLPPFSVAAVFIMPLFLCPLAGSKKEAWAYPVGLAAILLGASLWTRQVFFPVWLLLAIAPPLVLAYRFPHMKLEFRQFLFWFVGAYALSTVMVLAWPVMAGLGSPAEWISARLVELLKQSNSGNALLYRLTAAGYLSLPEESSAPSLLSSLLDQRPMSRQLYLSLELRFRQSLTALLPSLWMQVILLSGLMTGLRVWKTRCTFLLVDEEKKTIPTMAISPGFSGLSFGRGLCLLFLGAGAAGLLISISTINDVALAGQLLFHRLPSQRRNDALRPHHAAGRGPAAVGGSADRRGMGAGPGDPVSVRHYGSHAPLSEPGILSKAKGG